MNTLFSLSPVFAPQRIPLQKAELLFWPAFYPPEVGDHLLEELRSQPEWRTQHIRMFGRLLEEPRLTAHCGSAPYAYSGIALPPQPCPAVVARLQADAEAATGLAFNTALLNRYLTGSHYMGWHRDAEPSLGPSPAVASFSFGGERLFKLKPRDKANSEQSLSLLLPHGSLLLMAPGIQEHYLHALPKTAKAVAERINVTFRRVVG